MVRIVHWYARFV